MEYLFSAIEFAAFILPALPSNLSTRLTILLIYLVLHYLKANTIYSRIKKEMSAPLE